jgi:oxygen-dependent protoporphyrinogen oxidase
MARSCVVVGAGVAGLSAAYRLATGGLHVTVLESESQIGGRMRSERVGDFIINTGASIITSFFDATLALLRELQLQVLPALQPPGIIATQFGKLPFNVASPQGVWRFPLIPWSEKLRALAIFSARRIDRRAHIADLASLARMDRSESVERWGTRVMGRAGYEYLLRPGIEPFFSFDAREASAALGKALMHHAAKWEMLFLPDGMGSLCDALAQRLEVRSGCSVGAVEIGANGVIVHHSGGMIESDYAILALPAPAAAKLEGSLSTDDRRDLGAIRYAPNVRVYFGYERSITVQHVAVTASGPGRHPVSGVHLIAHWTPQYVPEGKALVLIQGSGWRSAELIDREPDKMVAALRTDGEAIFGRLADPDWVRIYPRRDASVIPEPGHYRRMQAFLRRPRPRLFFAGDWVTGSTVEGAIRTGLRAADAIVRSGG